MSSEPRANVFSHVKTRRQTLPFSAKGKVSAASFASSGYMVTRLSLRKRRPKPLTKLDRGHSKGTIQDLQKMVRSKPLSVQASQELGVREQ